MTQSFKILWFENEPEWYKMEKRRITGILTEHCLEGDIIRKNGNDFKLTEICTNSFDLILMDFDLISTTGDVIGSALRKHNILTDILFYSSQEDKMMSAIHNATPPIDGIYYTKRDSTIFTEKARLLISKIVKRSEDLIHLRGFVMDTSCDFEVRIKELLSLAWWRFTEDERALLEQEAKVNIDTRERKIIKDTNDIRQEEFVFPAFFNQSHPHLSHSDRLSLLNKVIAILQKDYDFPNNKKYNNFKSKYEEEISMYRNAFGHKKSCETTIEVPKGTFRDIDETFHKEMRGNLNKYDKLIRDLEVFITEKI